MLFRRIVLCALLAGAVCGLLLSAVQRWQVIPIISAAERYERMPAPVEGGEMPAHAHAALEHGAHEHSAEAWEPAPGMERIGFTVLSNVLTAAGFALVLLAVMAAAHRLRVVTRFDWHYGLLWGLAGYAVFFVAPALGLPPEIPGAEAAPLSARQLWWVLSVGCTAAGLAGAAFGRTPWRWAALALLALPYLVGAPVPAASPFASQSPAAAAELAVLARQFIWATTFANAVFWLALGSLSGWMVRRYLKAAVD
jgi:cobalt transporter subunit CbtA